jgi:hypothetical protein
LRARAARLAGEAGTWYVGPGYVTEFSGARYTTRAAWRASLWMQGERDARAGWHELATKIGTAYHKHVKSLAASSEAVCCYGAGGQGGESRDSYSKGWHNAHGPRRWLNYGAACVHGSQVTVYNHLGHSAATISLARLPRDWRGRITQRALLDGEILGLWEARMVVRYDVQLRRTGVAVVMPIDLVGRFGKWEHGKTYADCQREIRAKRAIVEAEEAKARESKREARRVHLVTVMCPRLPVTYQHARAAGLCDAGIRAYCIRHGLSVEVGAPASVLRASGDARAVRAIEVAAREAIAARA